MHQLLKLLSPETAHNVALLGLKNGFGPKQKEPTPATLQTKLFGKTLPNPVGLSAGADKEGVALQGWQDMGFGFVEMGTVTMHPRDGNPKPRVWRYGNDSVVNFMGLPGPGYTTAFRNIRSFRKHNPDFCIGVSIASPENKLSDLSTLALHFKSHGDYLALNISCPNVEGHEAVNAKNAMVEQIHAVRRGAESIPIMVKFGPTTNMDTLLDMADAAEDAGATGFIATNTAPFNNQSILDFASLPKAYPGPHQNGVGGYSGPRLLDISTTMISNLREFCGTDTPLIGVGGVQCGEDAQQLLDAGANAVQLYTGLITKGPKILPDITGYLGSQYM